MYNLLLRREAFMLSLFALRLILCHQVRAWFLLCLISLFGGYSFVPLLEDRRGAHRQSLERLFDASSASAVTRLLSLLNA